MNTIHFVNVVHGRARRREVRTAEILDAALEIGVAEGLEALTMQRLAGALDLAPAALYRYFASKEALLVELQRRLLLELAADLDELDARCRRALEGGAAPGTEALARLLAAVELYRALARAQPARFALLAFAVGDPRILVPGPAAAEVAAAAMPLFERVAGHLAAAAAAGALAPGDTMERAVLLWVSLHGTMQLRKLARLDPDRLDPDRLVPRLLHTLLTGWGARRELLDEANALLARLDEAPRFDAPPAALPRRDP